MPPMIYYRRINECDTGLSDHTHTHTHTRERERETRQGRNKEFITGGPRQLLGGGP